MTAQDFFINVFNILMIDGNMPFVGFKEIDNHFG
ncbi:Uncharacterised protein [Streptococcus pneumoniae]|nr:Uncharacterised protein [Streptococcus pneumoniae]CAG5927788.1 Uncharacterised protein [Streptococcus pneumoniae]CAG5949066.1 Uncharacterised protein [Streptococcus pneumoniae]CAG5955673.1 Uncharacterised protein [Streptococcus pneumoniae]CIW03126.1 Uncharacterised protein [Streptococcus pneumoniae]